MLSLKRALESIQLKSFFIIASCLISAVSYSQSGEIKVKFLGNCGLYLTDDTLNIYVDFPYKSGAFKYMEFDESELDSIQDNSIFIFTHKHADHYSNKNMRRVLRKKNGEKYGKWNIKELEALGEQLPDFSIQAIETEHSFSLKHYSYLITWHGKKIYFSGDIETTETVLTLKDLDYAFVPYWIVTDLMNEKVYIDAKMVGVYHFYPQMKVTNSSPETYKLLDNQGEWFSIK